MHKAIDGLNIRPDLLLIDGNDFIPYIKVTNEEDNLKVFHTIVLLKEIILLHQSQQHPY